MHKALRCHGGPINGRFTTDPLYCEKGPWTRIYSAGVRHVAGLLSPTYWPGAVGYYEREDDPPLLRWYDLET